VSAVEGLSIRPYLDNNIDLWIASDLRIRGFDAVHSLEIGHDQLTDEQHLRWAADQGRTVLTFDRQDFQDLAVEWFLRGEQHAGIIIAVAPPQLPISAMHRRLLAFLDRVTADEMRNEIRWLDEEASPST
jgi:hypothetical protein